MKRLRQAEYSSDSETDDEPHQYGVKHETNGKLNNVPDRREWTYGDSERDEESELSEEEQTSDDDEAIDEDAEEIPLGQIIARKNDGSIAGPAARTSKNSSNKKLKQKLTSEDLKRDHKHRPVQMSSKKRVSVLRETLQGGRHHGKDPRFDPLVAGRGSGPKLKGQEIARRRYAFIFDEKIPEQKRELQESLKKTKSEAKKAQIKAKLARLTQDVKTEGIKRRKEAAEEEERAKRRAARAAGKDPFYLKKSEKRRRDLLAKYEELKANGGLDRFLEKRRKKNAAKDHRYLPSRRDT